MNRHLGLTLLTATALAFIPLTGPAGAAPSGTPQGSDPSPSVFPAQVSVCGGHVDAPPDAFGQPAVSDCTNDSGGRGRQIYLWSVDDPAATVCLEGWGFPIGHPKGTWMALGCGSYGEVHVPWANHSGHPMVRATNTDGSITRHLIWDI